MTIIYQKNRAYSLVFGDINTGDGWEVSSSLNVSFDVNKSSDNKAKTNNCVVEVYNLSKERQKLLEQPYIACVLSAGYEDTEVKRLFAGQVTSATTRKSGTDSITQIQLGDSYTELNHNTLSKLVAPGRSYQDVIGELAKEIPGVSRTVFNGVNINSQVVDGYPLSGTAREMLDEIGNAVDVEWQIDDGVLYIADAGGTHTEDLNTVFVISQDTGMIERPYAVSGDLRRTARDKAKKGGVQVKVLLNPSIVCGSIVKLEDDQFDGFYKVASLRTYGEYRGSNWYTELRLENKVKV
ncbi:puncturing protein [Pseudomonas phage vB_PsaM_M1]|nr:puncturing protein [Pseudomonas phage vB_PsaM_M1]